MRLFAPAETTRIVLRSPEETTAAAGGSRGGGGDSVADVEV
jgi:hypothetical protein